MTKEELILKGKQKVRGNSDLMFIYISLFQEQFGHKPNCAGCTFDNDWRRFMSNETTIKTNLTNMENTFRLKDLSSEILCYVKDGITVRKYANKIDESFVIAFLTNGTTEEIEQRKKLFSVLPQIEEAQEEHIMTVAELGEWLKETEDIEAVASLLETEQRKGAIKILNERLDELLTKE